MRETAYNQSIERGGIHLQLGRQAIDRGLVHLQRPGDLPRSLPLRQQLRAELHLFGVQFARTPEPHAPLFSGFAARPGPFAD